MTSGKTKERPLNFAAHVFQLDPILQKDTDSFPVMICDKLFAKYTVRVTLLPFCRGVTPFL